MITNTANVTSSTADPNPIDNTATAETTVNAASLSLEFLVQPSNTDGGEAISPAVEVEVLDPLNNPPSAPGGEIALCGNPGISAIVLIEDVGRKIGGMFQDGAGTA